MILIVALISATPHPKSSLPPQLSISCAHESFNTIRQAGHSRQCCLYLLLFTFILITFRLSAKFLATAQKFTLHTQKSTPRDKASSIWYGGVCVCVCASRILEPFWLTKSSTNLLEPITHKHTHRYCFYGHTQN